MECDYIEMLIIKIDFEKELDLKNDDKGNLS